MKLSNFLKFSLLALLLPQVLLTHAAGIYRDGLNAESSGAAGINAVSVTSPVAIMTGNPAGLARSDESVTELNMSLADFDARFSNSLNSDRFSSVDQGLIPAAGFILARDESPLVWGFSATADVALETDFRLVDPPGGLAGVSYGTRQHASKFILVQLAGGVGIQLSDKLDIGASIGAVFNQNELTAPYIFQSQAPSILPGFKALLDLQVEGWGLSTQLGAKFRPNEKIELGVSYRPESRIDSEGQVSGDASAQLAQLSITGFQPDFTYDVGIKTRVPAVATLAMDIEMGESWNLLTQVDWVRTSTYNNLRLDLDRGNNPDLNGLLGDDGFTEVSPLGWDDQVVLRVGATYQYSTSWTLRAGIALTQNPIPSTTLTPLTGAISERVFGLGATRQLSQSRIDLSYQYVAEQEERVNTSGLLASEYSDSRFTLSGHWINLSWQF